MKISPNTYCEACDQPIGESVTVTGAVLTNDFVTCRDGINGKIVTFHKLCHTRAVSGAAADPDVQRAHHIGLAPVLLGLTANGIH